MVTAVRNVRGASNTQPFVAEELLDLSFQELLGTVCLQRQHAGPLKRKLGMSGELSEQVVDHPLSLELSQRV